jgi:hypothetical protein
MNDLWLLDIGAMTLRPIQIETPVPEPRSRHTVHMIDDTMHVFGGYDGSKPVAWRARRRARRRAARRRRRKRRRRRTTNELLE